MVQSTHKKTQKAKRIPKENYKADGIKSLDIMGEKFKMNYSEKMNRYRTRIGGVVTILITLASLISLIFISAQYFDNSSPVVTTTLELSRSAQSLNLYGQDLFAATSVSYNEVFEPFKMDRFITIKALLFKKTFNPKTNSSEIEIVKEYNYIPCPYLEESEPILLLIKKLSTSPNTQLMLCPNYREAENDVTISYDPQNLSSSFLSVKIYPCSLPEKNECYPVTKIFGALISTPEISNLISPSNFKDPIAIRWRVFRYLIDITRAKSFRYILQQTKILDDRHFYKKPEVRAEFGTFIPKATDTWQET